MKYKTVNIIWNANHFIYDQTKESINNPRNATLLKNITTKLIYKEIACYFERSKKSKNLFPYFERKRPFDLNPYTKTDPNFTFLF